MTSLGGVLVRTTTTSWTSSLIPSHRMVTLSWIGMLAHIILPSPELLNFLLFSKHSRGFLLLNLPGFFLPRASVATSCLSGFYIAAVEGESQIFNVILAPLQDCEPPSKEVVISYPRPPKFIEPLQKKQRRHSFYI